MIRGWDYCHVFFRESVIFIFGNCVVLDICIPLYCDMQYIRRPQHH